MVCSSCDNTCPSCAHASMRKNINGYNLQLDTLERFIAVTEKSNYNISTVVIDGDGEPLLWKYLNEGISILRKSKSIGNIVITTNGNKLSKLSSESWESLNTLEVSLYPNFKNRNLLDLYRIKYPLKIEVNTIDFFQEPKHLYPLRIPCECVCSGPMLYGDRIYKYCGPNIYDSIRYSNLDIEEVTMSIKENYLEEIDFSNIGNLEHCKYCIANNNNIFSLVKL